MERTEKYNQSFRIGQLIANELGQESQQIFDYCMTQYLFMAESIQKGEAFKFVRNGDKSLEEVSSCPSLTADNNKTVEIIEDNDRDVTIRPTDQDLIDATNIELRLENVVESLEPNDEIPMSQTSTISSSSTQSTTSTTSVFSLNSKRLVKGSQVGRKREKKDRPTTDHRLSIYSRTSRKLSTSTAVAVPRKTKPAERMREFLEMISLDKTKVPDTMAKKSKIDESDVIVNPSIFSAKAFFFYSQYTTLQNQLLSYMTEDGLKMLKNVIDCFRRVQKCPVCAIECGLTQKIKVCSECWKVYHFCCIEASAAVWKCGSH